MNLNENFHEEKRKSEKKREMKKEREEIEREREKILIEVNQGKKGRKITDQFF